MCVLCYTNCGVEVRTEGRDIVRVRGDKANPRSHGYACQKAQRLSFYGNGRQRITSPLKRRADGSGHDPIGWDQALSEIADRLLAIKTDHGGDAFLFYGGGGQGNHSGGPHMVSLMGWLGGAKYMNPLAQEKTGDFWVNGRVFGSQVNHTGDDAEEADLLFVLGCNPWLAHGMQDARNVINDVKRSGTRTMIVVDPRRTEAAAVADLHLQLRPGTDAFLLAALLAIIVDRNGADRDFLAARTTGFDEVAATLAEVPVDRWVAAAGVARSDVERAADMVIEAESMVVRVELGIQQSRHSTLNSYLEKLLYLVTGNFDRPGTHGVHSWLQPLWSDSQGRTSNVTGWEVIGGLLPPNTFSEEILTDDPGRVRAVWVDSNNPGNTAADTQLFEEAMAALELSVVVDIAYTETARLAEYVLPAASQYEKWEYTLFSLEYPTNYFQVRRPVFEPLEGTRPEPEIYARLLQEMDALPSTEDLHRLVEVAAADRDAFFAEAVALFSERPEMVAIAPVLLYLTLGATLPHGAAAAAPLWIGSRTVAHSCGDQVRRALDCDLEGDALGDELFDRLVDSPSGLAFTSHAAGEGWDLLGHADKRAHLAVPEMLDWIRALDPGDLDPDPAFPLVLSAGQRRSHNANQIIRDPAWRKTDPDGALWANPADLADLGIADGDWAVIESRRGALTVRAAADGTYRRGYCALPHGFGQVHGTADGRRVVDGPRVNLLTAHDDRDPIAGTPHHKTVAVRLRPASLAETATAELNAQAIRAIAATPASP